MTDPATSVSWTSWQDDGVLDDVEIRGADAAIAWARERASTVLIRLGHTHETYFSAGDQIVGDRPAWPPQRPPAEGWWPPDDAPLSPAEEVSASGEWVVELGLKLPELSQTARRVFATTILGHPEFHNVDEIRHPTSDSIEVGGILIASTRGEAERIGNDILEAARSAVGGEIPDWSTTGVWSWCRVSAA
jgi:hypothetical protein